MGNYTYEHRANYYDKHGEGPFPCHWCGETVTWETLHIDHLDDDKLNNDVGNLAATCPTCNQARGHDKIRKAMIDKVGILYEHEGLKLTAGDWAKRIGISRTSFTARVKAGWSVEKAVTTPRGKTGPRP